MITPKRILSHLRRAVENYAMIEVGDKIAVGLSGGKDSLTLLYGLSKLKGFYPKAFEIVAITIDCGFDNTDFAGAAGFCRELGVEHHVVGSNIRQVVFELRGEKNPCALCSKLRHGALNRAAKALGCNKVALAHHLDDSVETFMLNLIYESRLGSFSPVTQLDKSGLVLIRPLVYAPEKEIRSFAKSQNLPVLKNTCPADKHTKREEVKALLGELSKKYKDFKHHIFAAVEKAEISGYMNPKKTKGKKEKER